jgi:deoxyribonuclease IV
MPTDLRAALGGRPIGCHMPLGRGMVRAVERGHEIGAAVLQIFADNPTAWRRRLEPPTELPAFQARLAELGFGPTAIHASYLINLAGADDDFWARSVEGLAAELRMGARYRAAFVNIHAGSHRGTDPETGMARLGLGLARALAEVPTEPGAPLLVVENSAGGGDAVGVRLEQLATILEAALREGAAEDRLGFCLDTAHLWAAGYEISRPEAVDEVLRRFDELVGADRLAMLHLNDAKAGLGSHADRHEHAGAGQIGPLGMRRLLTHERLAQVPAYLETPGMDDGFDALNMARVRLLIAGEPLPDVPEAGAT